jgi:hypothetical protein
MILGGHLCRYCSTRRGGGVKLRQRLPSRPPYEFSHDVRESCVSIRIHSIQENEDRNGKCGFDSSFHANSIDL